MTFRFIFISLFLFEKFSGKNFDFFFFEKHQYITCVLYSSLYQNLDLAHSKENQFNYLVLYFLNHLFLYLKCYNAQAYANMIGGSFLWTSNNLCKSLLILKLMNIGVFHNSNMWFPVIKKRIATHTEIRDRLDSIFV